jgi:hypothetical protein
MRLRSSDRANGKRRLTPRTANPLSQIRLPITEEITEPRAVTRAACVRSSRTAAAPYLYVGSPHGYRASAVAADCDGSWRCRLQQTFAALSHPNRLSAQDRFPHLANLCMQPRSRGIHQRHSYANCVWEERFLMQCPARQSRRLCVRQAADLMPYLSREKSRPVAGFSIR